MKKNVCTRNKKRYFFLVQFNSTPDAKEMPFEATRNMPFSLVLQKLSSFQDSSDLKVLLVNLLAALNFANVFLK